MADKPKSILYKLEPVIKRFPAVTKPEGHVHFRTKLTWSLVALLAYFILSNIVIYGLSQERIDVFSNFRAILAGASGSLVHLGIGPIVTGSIIMQLFAGAKIINLDLTNDEDKKIYQGTQKVLVVVMIFVESVPQVFGFLTPSDRFVTLLEPGAVGGEWFYERGSWWASFLIVMQLAVGSYLVFLMDEVVSKWGLGSGISLFIAAGVSQSVFTGLVNWLPQSGGVDAISAQNPPGGVIPKTIYLLNVMSTTDLARGGFETILLDPPNPVIALISTIVTFVVVVFAESSRIELPLAHGKVRGARGRYPIRLLYASNIPVILAGALLANISLISILLWSGPLKNMPFIGQEEWVGGYLSGTGQNTIPYSGIAYYFSTIQGVQDWLMPFLSESRQIPYLHGGVFNHIGITDGNVQVIAHLIIYAAFMIGGSILFAIFWIETTNMGPDQVAKQIQKSGMQIPGFRRDPRVTANILARYIPVVTVIGGAAIGMLAVFADLLGTLGNATGTGILLAVGIFQRLYEQIAKEQAMEMHPLLRGFFGES